MRVTHIKAGNCFPSRDRAIALFEEGNACKPDACIVIDILEDHGLNGEVSAMSDFVHALVIATVFAVISFVTAVLQQRHYRAKMVVDNDSGCTYVGTPGGD